MAFDIEKMKKDGVSSHLIELASMNQETFLLLITRRLEHDKLFQQLLGENVGEIESMYPYAVAAGLMTEEDRKWLLDEGNPYKPQSSEAEVWLVGDTYEDVEGMREFTLSNSGDVDHMTELFTNSSNYEVYLNGELLPYVITIIEPAGVSWCDTEMPEHATKRVDVLGESSVATEAYADYMDASTAPTSVEVAVAHK